MLSTVLWSDCRREYFLFNFNERCYNIETIVNTVNNRRQGFLGRWDISGRSVLTWTALTYLYGNRPLNARFWGSKLTTHVLCPWIAEQEVFEIERVLNNYRERNMFLIRIV